MSPFWEKYEWNILNSWKVIAFARRPNFGGISFQSNQFLPWYCNRHLPFSMPKMLAVRSADAVPMIGWPDLVATCQTPSLCPEYSLTIELTIADCCLKLDTILLVCALILWLALTLLLLIPLLPPTMPPAIPPMFAVELPIMASEEPPPLNRDLKLLCDKSPSPLAFALFELPNVRSNFSWTRTNKT